MYIVNVQTSILYSIEVSGLLLSKIDLAYSYIPVFNKQRLTKTEKHHTSFCAVIVLCGVGVYSIICIRNLVALHKSRAYLIISNINK